MQKQGKELIQLKEVSKKFGKKIVLNHINLSIYPGEIISIIGENGSGKTTLLKLIAGFLKPDSGSIIYNSKDVTKAGKKISKDFGFATQENSFYPNLTVKENLKYFGSLYNIDISTLRHNVETCMALVKLKDSESDLARNLSTGMQRRLDIACSLINNPKVLILDEPTEDLDIFLRKEMLALIKKINNLGTTILMTSHLLSDIEQLSDRIAIIYKHTIIKEGPLSLLRSLSKKSSLDDVFSSIIKDA